jgi:hypothetical protein
LVNSVRTEIALGRSVGVGINVDGIVGTGLHAHLASNAIFVVKVNDAIVADKQGRCWAGGDTGCIGAVIAPHDTHFARC